MSKHIEHGEYKNILENMPICCVDVIVCSGKKVLLVLRKNKPARGEWWPPGGRVHKHEKLWDAAARKAYEEAGIRVRVIRQVGAYETTFDDGPFHDLKTGVHTVNVCFVAELEDKKQEVKIDSTSEEFRWFDKIEPYFPEYVKTILKDAKIF